MKQISTVVATFFINIHSLDTSFSWQTDRLVCILLPKQEPRKETQEINDAVKRMIYTGPRKFKCFLEDVEDRRRWGPGV